MQQGQRRATPSSRRGRQAGVASFALVVGGFTLTCAVQILTQIFSPPTSESTPPAWAGAPDCRAGLGALRAAVVRARRVVLHSGLDESPALAAFRRELTPEWRFRAELEQSCPHSDARAALEQLDEFRYAEEHAVRYEAARFHRVQREIERYLGPEKNARVPTHPQETEL